MRKKTMPGLSVWLRVALISVALAATNSANATAGAVDANGCHESKRVGLHCHARKVTHTAVYAPSSSGETKKQRSDRLARECKGQRNAGACLGYGSY